jgi:hypothetical protein
MRIAKSTNSFIDEICTLLYKLLIGAFAHFRLTARSGDVHDQCVHFVGGLTTDVLLRCARHEIAVC